MPGTRQAAFFDVNVPVSAGWFGAPTLVGLYVLLACSRQTSGINDCNSGLVIHSGGGLDVLSRVVAGVS